MEATGEAGRVTKLFFSYSHADEQLRDTLEKHLAGLKRQCFLDTWHDRRIRAGDDLHGAIAQELEEADIILLLVSADFLASDYCYDVEMQRAIERHNAGQSRVIPVILRPCDWHDAPFGKLMAAPKDGRPVTSWPDLDDAFLDIVRAIKAAIPRRAARESPATATASSGSTVTVPRVAQPRSSNLRTRKSFTEADQDAFLDSVFEFMAAFFQNSLAELEARNEGLSTRFRRVDANRFTAVVYRDGQAVARCKVVRGGTFGNGISYSASDRTDDNSCNENLSVEHDDQNMYLKPLGMQFHTTNREAHLTAEGASEFYWSLLIQPLQ